MTKTKSFLDVKYKKILLSFLLAWVIAEIATLTDGIIGGLSLGETAVAAVDLVSPLDNVISFASFLIATGAAYFYSQKMGAFKKEEAYKIVGTSFITSIGLGILLAGLMFLFREPFIRIYGLEGQLATYTREYYTTYIWVALISPVIWLIYQLVTLDGGDIASFMSDAIMAFGNIILSAVFVQWMGIKGLVYGGIAALLLGAVPLCLHFFFQTNSIRIHWAFDLSFLKEISKLGLMDATSYLYTGIVDAIMNAYILANFGEIYLPAYTIINTCLGLAEVSKTAIDSGSSFLMVAYGEDNNPGIKSAMDRCRFWTVPTTAILIVGMVIMAPHWPEIYDISDAIVLKDALFAGYAIPIAFVFVAVVYLYANYYSYIGHEDFGNLIIFNYSLLTPLVLSTLLGKLYGFKGLIMGFCLAPVVTIVLSYLFMVIKGNKKKMPFLLEPTDDIIQTYDLLLNVDNIIDLRNKVEQLLIENKIEKRIVNEVEMMVEDTLMRVLDENNKKKKIYAECTIFINDQNIRMITKDSGKIFDITDVDGEVKSLRCYVLAQMMFKTSEHSTTTTISFNRNVFVWER